MSVDAARDFLVSLIRDEALQDEILNSPHSDHSLIARRSGFEFTKQELEEATYGVANSTIRQLAEGDISERVARVAMAMLDMDRSLVPILLYGVVDAWPE